MRSAAIIAIALLILNVYLGVNNLFKSHHLQVTAERIENYDKLVAEAIQTVLMEIEAAKGIVIVTYQVLLQLNDIRSDRALRLLRILEDVEEQIQTNINTSSGRLLERDNEERLSERYNYQTNIYGELEDSESNDEVYGLGESDE